MELPKEKIEISVTGEQTREIVATTVGRPTAVSYTHLTLPTT